ncbi:MAG: hypothetical protein N2053_10265 [Chitinispirillaceae bacterium]|nr:hypothetical protein [Chitinispirillaceae bacterium]
MKNRDIVHYPRNFKGGIDPFIDFHPIYWNPNEGKSGREEKFIYSLKRNHGIDGTFKLHNFNDEINENRNLAEKIVVEYRINKRSYTLFSVADFITTPSLFEEESEGNLAGKIAERIARRITKYFLKHFSPYGKTGGIFDKRFNPEQRNDFIVANSKEYILKILQYPNMVILRKTGKGKYGYENIKELDGFFDYRFDGKRHILVLESKLEKININCKELINNLFSPLKELFPEAFFHYILFSDRNSVYVKNNFRKWRQVKQNIVNIYQSLKENGIGSLFFTFNESREDFERIKEYLMLQYRAFRRLSLTLHGKTIITEKEITIFDGAETPFMKLVRDSSAGRWREIPLKHKSKKESQVFPLF